MTVVLDSRHDIDLETFRRVAVDGEDVRIGAAAIERMEQARSSFMALLEADRHAVIYGTTTGPGSRAKVPIPPDEQRQAAQRMLLRRAGDALAELTASPVVELNRAVALGMAFGPAAGLEVVDELTSEPSLAAYHLLPSVRGDLLVKLGRFEEARAEFEHAAALTRNTRERTLLLGRAAACDRNGLVDM